MRENWLFAKLPEKLGGLNVPDIEQFWLSFKFSWLRRLISTQSFWPNIVLQTISQIQNKTVNTAEFLNFGPSLLCSIGKKINNKFWQQVLLSTRGLNSGAVFCYPEKLSISSFWHNDFIQRNNKVITYRDYPELNSKIFTLSDFFYHQSTNIMSKDDFCNRYNLAIDDNKYIEIRYIITLALQKIGLPKHKLLPAEYPNRPLLIDIALSIKKGCSLYYKILMKRKYLNNKNNIREEKWHLELDTRLSVITWDKIRYLNASINYENPIKWLQYQIVRNSLQTNVIVSHFKADVSPLCHYCQLEPEKISHLYWHCLIVKDFLNDVFTWVCNTGIQLTPTREQFLFGYLDQNFNTPCNYLILFLKKFIWVSKFKSLNSLSMVGFKNFLKNAIRDLKNIYEINNSAEFQVWRDLADLLPADHDRGQLVLPLLPVDHDQPVPPPLPADIGHPALPQQGEDEEQV